MLGLGAQIYADLMVALGRMYHNDCPGGAIIWALSSATAQEARRAILPLARASGCYKTAHELLKSSNRDEAQKCLGHMWTQDLAQARAWERAGEISLALSKLTDARAIAADVRTPMRKAAEDILQAKIEVRSEDAANREMIRSRDRVVRAEQYLWRQDSQLTTPSRRRIFWRRR